MERQDELQIVLYSTFLLCAHRKYITPSETEPELISKELALKQLKVEPWLKACLNEKLRQNVVEAVASSSIIRRKVKQMLSVTCSRPKRAAREVLLQPLRINVRYPDGREESREKLK